jgi:hypothetical protein
LAKEEGLRSNTLIPKQDKVEYPKLIQNDSKSSFTEQRVEVYVILYRQILSEEEVREIREGLKRKWD